MMEAKADWIVCQMTTDKKEAVSWNSVKAGLRHQSVWRCNRLAKQRSYADEPASTANSFDTFIN
jgi:hypothetical protein